MIADHAFSMLKDAVDLARARGAFDAVWDEVKADIAETNHESERRRLACIVASLVQVALDEDDLMRRALERFRRTDDGSGGFSKSGAAQ